MCTNDCLIYDTEYNVWYEAQTSGQKPGPRSGHAMARIGNKIYVFGGASKFQSTDQIRAQFAGCLRRIYQQQQRRQRTGLTGFPFCTQAAAAPASSTISQSSTPRS